MIVDKAFINQRVRWIKEEAGSRRAVAAVSGGVDSTTTAVLGDMALGERLVTVFIDDGLMRKGEPERVVGFLRRRGMNYRLMEVQDEFFKSLRGLTDPEEKRKAFRKTFYDVLGRAIREEEASCLMQGTIAADIVETRAGVKTQHNVLSQIGIDPKKDFGFKLIEPLADLYKPEVRNVAKELGLPTEVVERKPFPGPGLSVRIVGEVTPPRVEAVREATAIVEEELVDIPCFQAFAVLMSDMATGITADGRRKYGEIIVIRAVDSEDAMTATSSDIRIERLKEVGRRIVDALPNLSRVLYDLSDKPPATIEFE